MIFLDEESDKRYHGLSSDKHFKRHPISLPSNAGILRTSTFLLCVLLIHSHVLEWKRLILMPSKEEEDAGAKVASCDPFPVEMEVTISRSHRYTCAF